MSAADGMPADPFTYIGRVARDADGRVRTLEVFGPKDTLSLAQGDELITFTTVVDLEGPPPALEP